jgi:hypothetical protein
LYLVCCQLEFVSLFGQRGLFAVCHFAGRHRAGNDRQLDHAAADLAFRLRQHQMKSFLEAILQDLNGGVIRLNAPSLFQPPARSHLEIFPAKHHPLRLGNHRVSPSVKG